METLDNANRGQLNPAMKVLLDKGRERVSSERGKHEVCLYGGKVLTILVQVLCVLELPQELLCSSFADGEP